ncbi:MAG: glycosyltransferase family 4 protein [Acidobacteriota bacterium]|nr:glycosyltransferase family 4 protein [Acidobacteriota bacterium]
MKILFYSHTGTVSGAENILLLAVKRLNRGRFTATAICPAEGNLAEKIRELGVSCKTIAPLEMRFTWRVDSLFKYLLSFWRTFKQLRREIKKAEPDLIHANSIRAGLVATAASVGMKTPVFWHLQDELPRHPLSSAIRLFAAASSSRVRLIAASQATADSFRGRVLRFFKNRLPLRVIHNVIELENFEIDSRNRQKIREELRLGENEFVIGIVGQITTRKGQLELIRTFAEAKKQMSSSTLLVVGAPMFNRDDLYFEELKETAREPGLGNRVRFPGKRGDVAAVMQSLDALVVNSKSEAFVIVALEAMACGTPVIATEVGGIREMIEHKVNGWLVPFGDERLLSEALITLNQEPEMRSRFSVAGKKTVAEQFHAEKFITDLEDFFEQSAVQSEEQGAFLLAKQ